MDTRVTNETWLKVKSVFGARWEKGDEGGTVGGSESAHVPGNNVYVDTMIFGAPVAPAGYEKELHVIMVIV